jgi:hypothetical protein
MFATVWRPVVCVFAAAVVLFCDVAPAQPPIDTAFIRSTVERLGAVIAREHFDAEIGHRVERALRERAARGDYDRETELEGVATALTRTLVELTGDKHLALMVSVGAAEPAPPGPTARPRCSRPCGFAPVEVLDGNIGYVNVSFFFRPEEAYESVADAMHTVRDTKALIFDMRPNGGGSPGTVALLVSYLVDRPGMPLFEMVERSGEVTRFATEQGGTR